MSLLTKSNICVFFAIILLSVSAYLNIVTIPNKEKDGKPKANTERYVSISLFAVGVVLAISSYYMEKQPEMPSMAFGSRYRNW